MSNPLQRTPVVDVNGHLTHRNKRVGAPAKSNRIKDVGAPITIGKPAERYKAPNHPNMFKQVRYNGQVTTWGKVLESINPAGINRSVPFGEKAWKYTAVHPDNPSRGTIIPASVAKASGLADISDPIIIADGEYVIATVKYEKALADIPRNLYGSTGVSKWHDAANEQEKVVRAAQEKVDYLRRERERDAIEEVGTAGVEAMLYDEGHANRYKVEAMLDFAVDQGDTELVKKIANARIRRYLGQDYRDGLIGHPNPAVRGAFIEGNMSLSKNQVSDVADHDTDDFVVSVAKANIAMRKATGITN